MYVTPGTPNTSSLTSGSTITFSDVNLTIRAYERIPVQNLTFTIYNNANDALVAYVIFTIAGDEITDSPSGKFTVTDTTVLQSGWYEYGYGYGYAEPSGPGYNFTQGYGYTSYARRGAYGGAPHNGIDIVSGHGSAIKPIGEGTVLTGGYNNGFGNWIAIRHPNDMVSVYAHMAYKPNLTSGTAVDRNSVIGYEGSTGNSTGSHLHLSLYKDFFTYIRTSNGQLYFNYFEGTVNPLDYLPKR